VSINIPKEGMQAKKSCTRWKSIWTMEERHVRVCIDSADEDAKEVTRYRKYE